MTFFKRLYSSFFNVVSSPVNFYNWIRLQLNYISEFFSSLIHHFKILKQANISLGKYHIQNNNLNDAALRFWITDKIIAPNDDENNYWNAWVFIMQKKYLDALNKLQNNKYDKISLYDYIANMSSVHDIPEAIYNEYNALTVSSKYSRYFNDKKNVFEEFINVVLSDLRSYSDDKINILEIGTNPILIFDLIEKTAEIFEVDGVNFDEINHNNSRNYNSKSKIYENLYIETRGDFPESSKKYEVIFSFDSMSYSVNILPILKRVKSKLSCSGSLFVCLPKGELTKLDASKNCFVYSQKFLEEQLKLAEFETTSITSVVLDKQNEYFIIVAK
jgi:hypothetical protein